MVFVEFPQRDHFGFVTRRFIKLDDIESIGLHPDGTEIILDSGYVFVTTKPIASVIKLVECAFAKRDSLI